MTFLFERNRFDLEAQKIGDFFCMVFCFSGRKDISARLSAPLSLSPHRRRLRGLLL